MMLLANSYGVTEATVVALSVMVLISPNTGNLFETDPTKIIGSPGMMSSLTFATVGWSNLLYPRTLRNLSFEDAVVPEMCVQKYHLYFCDLPCNWPSVANPGIGSLVGGLFSNDVFIDKTRPIVNTY